MKYIKRKNEFLIRESLDIEQFYIKNDINEDELSYLGSGDFGEAYSIGNSGRVLKITKSKSEFEIAKELENTTTPIYLEGFAKVYKTTIVGSKMYIILEELDTDSSIEDLYYELENILSEQGLPMQYLDHLDTDEIELSEELIQFMDGIETINRAYRTLGIEASDLRPENMGYSKEGTLKAFDIEDKKKTWR